MLKAAAFITCGVGVPNPPPPPPPAPEMQDEGVVTSRDNERRRRRAAASNTFLTQGQEMGSPSTASKTLLGQ